MGQVKGIILLLVAIVLCVLLFPVGFAIGLIPPNRNKYLYNICIGLDQLGNVVCANLFNWLLIKKDAPSFGCPDETISSVIGKNKLNNNLTILGKILDLFLESLDKNHTINSIENPNNK
jgi:hypothetical protein